MAHQGPQYRLERQSSEQCELELSGSWTKDYSLPDLDQVVSAFSPDIKTVSITSAPSLRWDSMLLVFVKRLEERGKEQGFVLHLHGIPQGARTMLSLASRPAAPPPSVSRVRYSFPARVGLVTLRILGKGRSLAEFTGEIVLALVRVLRGTGYFPVRDFFYFLQHCGAEALPIVSLISFLVGVILAFVGAVQLQMFGAQIYVANLVALSMVLEMGAMMSGVIIAGRTGAAYAAQLASMQTNEEIDALRTLGISPICYLVLPRMLALACMLPLLCLYADLLGIAGGTVIGTGMLDLSLQEYLLQTRKAIHLHHIGQGVTKSAVYGVLISFAGCYSGMHSGRNASAVGEAATSAVVMSIVLMVLADALLTVIYST